MNLLGILLFLGLTYVAMLIGGQEMDGLLVALIFGAVCASSGVIVALYWWKED